jgi:outer membrane beta-barrel protein
MTFRNFLCFLSLASSLNALAGEATPVSDVETVYIVQPKSMFLRGRFEVLISGAYNMNDEFVSQSGMSGQIIYHLRENLAIALQGTYLFGQGDSSLSSNLSNLVGANGAPVRTPQNANITFLAPYVRYYRMPWLASGEVQWTPILGKISFHDWSLGLFQFFVSAGVGVSGLELRDINNGDAAVTLDTNWSFATILGGGLRFYFADHFGIRIEIKDFIEPLVARSSLPFTIPPGNAPAASSFLITHSPIFQAGVSFIF